jgi:hypothetical protein
MILEDSFVESLLEKFKNASIPTLVMPESYLHDAPIDGTMCEIVMGGAFTLSLFRWYTASFADEPPSEWEALGKAVRETLVSLQEAMDKK